MNLTLRQLQIFEAVARLLSFTRASEELHLTQPAVSMQIKQLEQVVGLPLFEQVGKKIHLTEAGHEMAQYSERILAIMSEAIKQGVEAGLGLALLSAHTLEMGSTLKRLVILDVEGFPVVRDWYIVHRAGKRLSALAQTFKDFIMRATPEIIPVPEMKKRKRVGG